MLDLIPEHQRMDLTIFRNTLLSPPNPEKDKDLLKTAKYNKDIQAVFWENGKPVGGSVWIDATPRSKNLPKGCIVSDDSYFRHRYKTSFSYNLNYNDLVTNLNAYTATHGVTGWNYVENRLYIGGMPTEDGRTINKNTWEYPQLLYVNGKSTPNVALEHLNYGIPVFVVQGMHMLNRTIAPKPVLDGVLVFRNSQVDAVRGALSNLEVKYGFKTYKTYNNNCFGSLAPYYNILPDHAYGVSDIVVFHNMCLKLDLAMKYLQENKLPFPFIIQLANPERILHYTKEEVADVFKRYIYTYEKDKSEKQLERLYMSTLKNCGILDDKAPIFKPSQRKINSLIYCYDAYTWDINIPTQAEVQYLYNQICLFNKGILGQ